MKANVARNIYLVITISAALLLVLLSQLFASTASAANNSDVTQQITAGTLATDILDNNRASVGSPTAALTSKIFSFSCYSGGTASTGLLGTNTQRIYVMNPGAANNGWTLTMAATGGPTSVWANTGVTQTYDFNDAGGSGCTDGGDADSRGGQITVDPSGSTLTADCLSCANTSITKGSSTAYVQDSTNSVTLLSAAAGSDDVYRGYLTDVGLSQTIPAEQAVDSYAVNMTITVTAL